AVEPREVVAEAVADAKAAMPMGPERLTDRVPAPRCGPVFDLQLDHLPAPRDPGCVVMHPAPKHHPVSLKYPPSRRPEGRLAPHPEAETPRPGPPVLARARIGDV